MYHLIDANIVPKSRRKKEKKATQKVSTPQTRLPFTYDLFFKVASHFCLLLYSTCEGEWRPSLSKLLKDVRIKNLYYDSSQPLSLPIVHVNHLELHMGDKDMKGPYNFCSFDYDCWCYNLHTLSSGTSSAIKLLGLCFR